MQILINFLVSTLVGLAVIGAIFAFAALGNGAEGLVEEPTLLWVGVACAFLPLLVGCLYLIGDWKFFGISPKIVFVGGLVASLGLHLMGNSWHLGVLVLRGLEPFDYSVKEGAVYFKGEKIPDSTGEGFRVLVPQKLARDAKHIYLLDAAVLEVHAASFESLTYGYYRDQHRVYFMNERLVEIEGADSATFQISVVNSEKGMTQDALDKHQRYLYGRPFTR